MPTSLGIRPMLSREPVSFPLQPLAKTTKTPSHIKEVFQLFCFIKFLSESFNKCHDLGLGPSPDGCSFDHAFIRNGGPNQNNPCHHELPLVFHSHQSQSITNDSKNYKPKKTS